MSTTEQIDPAAVETLLSGLLTRDWHAISGAFRYAPEAGLEGSPATWALLADVMSMALVPGNAAEPFSPVWSDRERRSLVPSDLSGSQTALLSSLLDGLTSAELVSRMGDVLWVARRDGRAAIRAVPAYLEVARRLETPEDWFGAVEHYERAARLASMLGKRHPVTGQALACIAERAMAAGDSGLSTLQYSLLSLLHELRFGDAGAFAAVCLGVAVRSRDAHDLDTAKEFFGLAARFLERAGNQAGADQARLEMGETLVLQAEAQERTTNPAFAQHIWEEAIQVFRGVAGGKARLPELHRRLNACGREALKLMKRIDTTIDIRELVEIARKQVMGRTLPEAVCALADIQNLPDPDEVRARVVEATSRSFFSNMFSSLTYDRHGRVVDRQPGLHGAGPEDEEKATDGLMQRDVDLDRGLDVAGSIGPALGAILEEHVVEPDDVAGLLHGSKFVPEQRMELFIQGLAAGFRYDLATAAHVLVPQVENAVRALLLGSGAIPSTLTDDMVQQDWGLGRMLDQDALGDILGKDAVHGLKRLLVVQGGPNLRNRLAHGMLEPNELRTSPVLYLWWLVLKLSLYGTDAFESYVASMEAASK